MNLRLTKPTALELIPRDSIVSFAITTGPGRGVDPCAFGIEAGIGVAQAEQALDAILARVGSVVGDIRLLQQIAKGAALRDAQEFCLATGEADALTPEGVCFRGSGRTRAMDVEPDLIV
jgi:hypothetical protein